MTMTKTVKHGLHTIGDRGSDMARAFGSGTADVAKRFGRGTADVVDRIGPKRALIGLAVLVAAIGGSIVLVRYLRARADNDELASDDMSPDAAERSARSRSRSAARRANSLSPH